MKCNCCKDTGYVMGMNGDPKSRRHWRTGQPKGMGYFKGIECKKCDYWQKQKDDAKNWKASKELTDLFKF
jgi:hypothetical protein|tara:strand:- start:145 stop:354 length:210 start_codon:yes stop_codon:yes gene_type:complete